MKILHVNDIAGVSSLLVQGLRRRGFEADSIMRRPHPYGFPHITVLKSSAPEFLFRVLKSSQSYDIVHTHALSYRPFFNVDIFALKALKRKVIVHLHGTEIRNSHNRLSTRAALEICDQVLISTLDLLPYRPDAIWLPVPLDPAFKPLENPRRYGKALYFEKPYESGKRKSIREECERKGLELTILSGFIPYSQMSSFLNKFEYFFDQSTFRVPLPVMSKMALEAMACGCKVIRWDGVVKNPEKILRNHDLNTVIRKLVKIYETVLFSSG